MKTVIRILALASLLMTGFDAYAQACPTGTPNCIPWEAWPGANGNNTGGNVPQVPVYVPPQPIWQDRWGAIAVDFGSGWGGIAVTSDRFSKSDAERRVLNGCREEGGKDCRVLLAYYNQCGAYAESPNGYSGSGGAGDRIAAGELAVEVCEKAGGSGCEVIYVDCSYPVQLN